MLVNISDLPDELIKKLPITLKIQKYFDTKYITDESLRTEIENYIELKSIERAEHLSEQINSTIAKQTFHLYNRQINNSIQRNYQQLLKKTLDIYPEKDIYGLKLITEADKYILEQIKTFLTLGEIEIPFSPEINFDITKYIFHNDSPYIKEELYDIINDFITILTTELDLDENAVQLESVDIQKIVEKLYTTYIVNVIIRINGKNYTLNLNFELDK